MKIKKFIVALAMLLLSVTAISCGVSQGTYNDLQKEYDNLGEEYNTAKVALTLAQNERDTAKAQLTSTQNELQKIQAELTAQAAALAEARSSNDTIQKHSDELENELNATLDTQVKLYFKFNFQYVDYNWMLPIPLKSYLYYKEQTRPTVAEYETIVLDSGTDSIMTALDNLIKDAAGQYNLRRSEIANLVVRFTGTLNITDNDVTKPHDNYARYPVETLFDQGGDSEDTSLLAASLLKRQDFDMVFFVFEPQRHVALGVYLPGLIGDGWEYQQKRYFYLETTGNAGALGNCPYYYQGLRPTIIPIGQ